MTIVRNALFDSLSKVNTDQVCKTCTHNGNRTWAADPEQVRIARAANNIESTYCQPSDDRSCVAVVKITPVQDEFGTRSERLSTVAVPVTLRDTAAQTVRVTHMVDTCGHKMLRKCNGCKNFVSVSVSAPIKFSPNSTPRYRDAVVGGYCALEAGCKPHYAPKNQTMPSCLNCANLATATILDEFDRTPVKTDLSRVEMAELRKNVALDAQRAYADGERPMPWLIWNKMRNEILSNSTGVMFTFGATLIETHPDGTKILVRFDGHFEDVVVDCTSDLIAIDETSVENRLAITFTGPLWRKYGLSVSTNMRITTTTPPAAPAKVRVPNPDIADRYDPFCHRCAVDLPCLHHAKLPIHYDLRLEDHSSATDPSLPTTVTYRDPGVQLYVYKPHPLWQVNISPIYIADEVRSVVLQDGYGSPASAHVVRMKRKEVLAHAQMCEDNGELGYVRAMREAIRQVMRHAGNRSVTREVGFGSDYLSGAEWAKRHCDLNVLRREITYDENAIRYQARNGKLTPVGQGVWRRTFYHGTVFAGRDQNGVPLLANTAGLDFRTVFGDTFGQPREQNDRSWAYQDENEALMYAGVTPRTRGERAFSDQLYHEEVLANEAIYTHGQAEYRRLVANGTIKPVEPATTFIVRHFNVWGDERDNIDAEQEAQDRARYIDWLDEQESEKVTEEIGIDTPLGMLRVETTYVAHWDHRFAAHGYSVQRLAKKPRGTAKTDAPLGPDDLFKMRQSMDFVGKTADSSDDVKSGYVCTKCEQSFTEDEISYDLECPSCQGAVVYRDEIVTKRTVRIPVPSRIADGMSRVLLVDRTARLEQTRLLSIGCDNWVRRGSNPLHPITIKEQASRELPEGFHPRAPMRWSWAAANRITSG